MAGRADSSGAGAAGGMSTAMYRLDFDDPALDCWCGELKAPLGTNAEARSATNNAATKEAAIFIVLY